MWNVLSLLVSLHRRFEFHLFGLYDLSYMWLDSLCVPNKPYFLLLVSIAEL